MTLKGFVEQRSDICHCVAATTQRRAGVCIFSTFDSHAREDSFQQLDIVKWYEYDSKHKGWTSVFVAESWPWCCGCGFNGSLRPSSLRLPNCGAKAAVAQYNVFNHSLQRWPFKDFHSFKL